jgi:hypothetical protein
VIKILQNCVKLQKETILTFLKKKLDHAI